jgi:hypothetical protein
LRVIGRGRAFNNDVKGLALAFALAGGGGDSPDIVR